MCGNAIVSICVMLKKQRVVFRVLKYLPVHSVHSREALRVDMHSDVGMLAHSHILCHSLWLAVRCLQAVTTHTFSVHVHATISADICAQPCRTGHGAYVQQLQEIMSSDDYSLPGCRTDTLEQLGDLPQALITQHTDADARRQVEKAFSCN